MGEGSAHYSQSFCFSRRYIIVLKLSVREIEREALIVVKTVDYIPENFPFKRYKIKLLSLLNSRSS